MFRYVLLGVIFTALIVGYHLLEETVEQVSNSDSNHISTPAKKTPPDTQTDAPANKPQAIESSTPAKNDADLIRSMVPDPLLDQMMLVNRPWVENKNPPLIPARYQQQGIDARPLKVNTHVLSKLQPGDELPISIPQTGQDFNMQVEEIGRHLNGDRSLRGHLIVSSDLPYSVIMTAGANSTYATINTPDGSYTLEANGEDGWIMSLAELDRLIDPNLKDYLIPNIRR